MAKPSENNRTRRDLLKIKQKVFESYPINSVARKQLVQEEKLRDINIMTKSLVPQDIVDLTIKLGKQSLEFAGKRMAAGLLGLVILSCVALYISTVVETFFVCTAGFFVFSYLYKYTKIYVRQFMILRSLERDYTNAKDMLKRLKKDFFK